MIMPLVNGPPPIHREPKPPPAPPPPPPNRTQQVLGCLVIALLAMCPIAIAVAVVVDVVWSRR